MCVKPKIRLIIHNVRSAHNVGSIFRTADGLGVDKIYLSGYSPYPVLKNDKRLPHIARKVDDKIKKTALGAESYVKWQKIDDEFDLIEKLKSDDWQIVCLEQTPDAVDLNGFVPEPMVALIVGNEIKGVDEDLISASDISLNIPMFGKKESYNVAEAAAMAIYSLRFFK